MELFWDYRFKAIKTGITLLTFILLLQSCATQQAQYGKEATKTRTTNGIDTTKIAHTFYLIGDAGNADLPPPQQTLELLSQKLASAGKNSTLLFLGDNIYPKGMPNDKKPEAKALAETKLSTQLALAKNFKGQTVFIPGNHDWYSGIKGLERQAQYITTKLNDKRSFLPQKNCAIESVKINNNLTMIVVDSQWFLEDWNQHPTINEFCDIKTREDFFEELEDLLNKNRDKKIVLALHHPLQTNGSHGGQFSLEKQLFPLEQKIPLPIIGSVINLLRKTSGISPQDIQNKQYTILTKRIKTLLQAHNNVVVVSGHNHNLQYIDHDNIKQIISGAGSKSEAARAIFPNDFSYGGNGYATLSVYKNGRITASFFGNEKGNEQILFETTLFDSDEKNAVVAAKDFPKTTTASIYTQKQTRKKGFYKFLFGTHYRKVYSTKIAVPTVTLDTLYGGLQPKRAGGGHQSNSLQLVDKDGKEYVMRALKKSATRFLQAVAFKDQYVVTDFEDTYAEDFLFDFYTTSHPYTPFAVGNLADKIGVYHTNPKLFYIPKHNALKEFNANFGNELYMVEERPSDSQIDNDLFDNPDKIIDTDELLSKLHKDEKYQIDEKAYIRARLFDMLIGDWDRHSDQWRWSAFKEGKNVIYKPIPKDRDQAFSKYDGALLSLLMNMPPLRHMQTFNSSIRNVKWLNREPYPQDLALLRTATEADWIEEAKYIQNHLSDQEIEEGFASIPNEIKGATIDDIIQKLKARMRDLPNYAKTYYDVLQKTVVIVGTNKKEQFSISFPSKNEVEVVVSRLKKEGPEWWYTKRFDAKTTKTIWIYGLDDDDVFEVNGKNKSGILLRLLGGQNNDSYTVTHGKNIMVYDFKSKPNTYNLDGKTKKVITDDYDTQYYNYEKPKYNAVSGLPFGGYNPDDGVKLGLIASYTVNRFKQNPFTQKHILKANYFFATSGFELLYNAHFPKALDNWDLDVASKYTSPNFTINFFGYGNETINNDETFGMDYNRVRLRTLSITPTLKKIGRMGSEWNFAALIERITVEESTNRFINTPGVVNPAVFERQKFAGASASYSFENYDLPAFPSMGFGFSIKGTWKMNLEELNRNFTTLETKINLNHRLDKKGKLVLATILKSKILFNDHYEFYQGATLGGDYDLRGFRNERFLGKRSFYQSSDIRWQLGKIKKSLLPLSYGLLGGFDYGRVWLPSESSSKWHQAFGGGLWLNGLNVLTARITYFKSRDEEARLSVGLGFGF